MMQTVRLIDREMAGYILPAGGERIEIYSASQPVPFHHF
jgi:hypothetical protein